MRFPRALIRLLGRVHTPLYRLSGGRLGGRVGRADVVLLTTTGRRSGLPRTAPVLCIRDGERFVVVASQGGHDTHPAWYLNLRADPRATVQLRRRTVPVRALELDGSERDRLWRVLVDAYPAWRDYETRTDRRFPVIALAPQSPAGAQPRSS